MGAFQNYAATWLINHLFAFRIGEKATINLSGFSKSMQYVEIRPKKLSELIILVGIDFNIFG
jgi:hypothetical protein